MFPTAVAALPLLILSLIVAPAGDVHQGNVFAVGENSITIQDVDGVTEMFTLAEDCQITHSGKPATLKDIDNGDVAKVTVTTVKGKLVATVIEAKCRA
jgi:hypothetical protein